MSRRTEDEAIEEAAKAMWMRWAKISDPDFADRRWARMSDKVRQCFVDEARTAIETYRYLMQI